MRPGYNWHCPLSPSSWTPLYLQSVMQHTHLFRYHWFDLRVVYFSCQVWVFFQHTPVFFKVLPNTDHYKNCTKCTSHLTKALYDSKQFPVFHFVTISLFWHQLPHPIHMQDFRLRQQCSCGLCSSGIWHCINGWLLIMSLNHTAVSKCHALSASDTMPYPEKNQDLQERQQNSTGKMF